MTRLQRALESWRLADAKAREAERELASAWAAFARNKGQEPETRLISPAAWLRSTADDGLNEYIDAMRAESAACLIGNPTGASDKEAQGSYPK